MYFNRKVNLLVLSIVLIESSHYGIGIIHLKRQFRVGWIGTVFNYDWPSKPGLSIEQQKIEFKQLIQEAIDDKLNALFVQIRPTADSFYPSTLFPWSEWLTGVQGLSAGYDPLEFMINETHNANLEFHAWFNPYRVSTQPDIDKLIPEHIARRNPDWAIVYGDWINFNPGLNEVREYVISGVLEVVNNYDIDGVFFDDYFYPYPIANKEFPDNETFIKYGSKTFDNIDDWRRNNTNNLIKELGIKIKQIKPHMKYGISPFGVWRNIADDPTGSNTTAKVSCYDTLYADTRYWIENCWIDYIIPQLYWPIGYKVAAYEVLIDWWSRELRDSCVHLFIGHYSRNVGSSLITGWLDPHEIENQMILNLNYSNAIGEFFWNTQSLVENKLGFRDILRKDVLSKPALIPQYSFDAENFTEIVTILQASKRQTNQIDLYWSIESTDQSNTTSYFIIYRFDNTITRSHNTSTADNILAIVKYDKTDDNQHYVDTDIKNNNSYSYYISAVTKYHTEGPISSPLIII